MDKYIRFDIDSKKKVACVVQKGEKEGLSSLRELCLEGTQVRDLEPIKGLSSLRDLFLAVTKVSDEEVSKLREAVPRLNIHR